MAYRRGNEVEVISHEKGLEGSYFEAIVVTKLKDEEYIVSYRSLLEQDLSGPLREVVPAKYLRPVPPEIPATEFRLHDSVDAYYRDGWWKGKVIGRIESVYNVYFHNSGEELPYGIDRLRVHQDWVDGRWVTGLQHALLTGRYSVNDGHLEEV